MADTQYTKYLPALLDRQGHKCHYCGNEIAKLPGGMTHTRKSYSTIATVDHIVPRINGGGNNIDNLVASCGPCNHTKSNLTYDQFTYIITLDDVSFNRFLQKRKKTRDKNHKAYIKKHATRHNQALLHIGMLLYRYAPKYAAMLTTEFEKNSEVTGLTHQKKSNWEIKLKSCKNRRIQNRHLLPRQYSNAT